MKLTSFNNLLAAAFVVSAAAGVAASCQQTPTGPETPDPLDDTTEVIIPVSLERPISPDADSTTPDTRVTVNPTNGVTAWEVGDEVSVYIKPTTSSSGEYVTANVKDNAIHVSIPATKMRAGYAVYPAGKADGNASTVYVTYPSSYDMTGKDLTATNNWAPTPMVALNTEGDDLRFFHIGGLLRLHVTDIPSGTTSLTLTFTITGSNYLAGKFTVVNPGTINATTTYYTGGTNSLTFSNLTITNNEVYINLPIPTTDLSTLSKITIANIGGTSYTTQRDITGWGTIAHAQGKKVSASFISVTHSSEYTGRFRGYELSKGYLVWDTDAGEYKLSDPDDPFLPIRYYGTSGSDLTAVKNTVWHQWGGSGLDNSLKGRIDGNPAASANITNGIAIDELVWKIPSSSQWATIKGNGTSCKINSTTAGYSVVRVSLAGATSVGEEGYDYHSKGLNNTSGGAATGNNGGFQVGLLLVPDYTEVSCPGITANNVSFTSGTTISWTALKKLLDGGCVFLPAAGYLNGYTWGNGGANGFYWSATQKDLAGAYRLNFDTNNVPATVNEYKYYHMPVKLLRE